MNCPQCGASLTISEAAEARCPQCGHRLNRGTLGIVKASSVRVAAGETDEVYSSLDDLPADLRRQLQRALNGPESETILIADEKGREHVFAVIEGLPPDLRKRVLAALRIPGRATPLRSTAVRAALVLAALIVVMLVVSWIWLR